MNRKPQNSKGWNACPPGEFRRLGGQLAGRARRKHAFHLAGLAIFAVAGVALAVGAVKLLPHEKAAKGLSCPEVRAMAADYLAGNLDRPQATQVKAHLARCRRCRRIVNSANGATAKASNETDCVERDSTGKCCGSDCGTSD